MRSRCADCVFVLGLSIGGMIAQGLAAKRLDLVRAVVPVQHRAQGIGTRAMWEERIATVETQGSRRDVRRDHGAPGFSRDFRDSPAVTPWRRMVEGDAPAAGYAGCSAAIAGHGFLYADRRPAPARAGHRRERGRLDAPRSGARNGRSHPRRALRADPGRGHLPSRRTAEEVSALFERIFSRYRPHATRGMSASPFDSALYRDLFGRRRRSGGSSPDSARGAGR